MVIAAILKKIGVNFDIVSDGLQALAAVKNKQYDLLLMDCQMPVMDGFETTRRIRLLEGDSRAIKIVALTTNAMGSDREYCLAAGMNDYISKPYKSVELESVIAKMLS